MCLSGVCACVCQIEIHLVRNAGRSVDVCPFNQCGRQFRDGWRRHASWTVELLFVDRTW